MKPAAVDRNSVGMFNVYLESLTDKISLFNL